MRRIVIGLALLATLTACSDNFFDPTPNGKTGSTGVQLVGKNIRMLPSEAAAIRVSFRPKDPSVRVRIARSSSEGRVSACPMRSIDDPLPPQASCLADLPNGVRSSLTTPGLGAVALVRDGDPISIDLLVDYEEDGRAFEIRMPTVAVPPGAAACKDNACNPFFELTPVHGGTFTSTATFQSGTGKLELLAGRVLARSFSSTGIPYGIAATQTGPSPLTVTAQLNAPSEYALALSNTGVVDMTVIRIDATWP